jgi:hypothetical protein
MFKEINFQTKTQKYKILLIYFETTSIIFLKNKPFIKIKSLIFILISLIINILYN